MISGYQIQSDSSFLPMFLYMYSACQVRFAGCSHGKPDISLFSPVSNQWWATQCGHPRIAKQRDRVIGGRRIVTAGKSKHASQWMLVPTSQMTQDEVNIVNISEPFPPLPHECIHAHAHAPALAHENIKEGEKVHQGSPCSPGEVCPDSTAVPDPGTGPTTHSHGTGYEEF